MRSSLMQRNQRSCLLVLLLILVRLAARSATLLYSKLQSKTLSMGYHISSLCRAAYLEMRRIATIPPYPAQTATAQLVSSSIVSILRVDCCNSIFACLPPCLVSRVQRVQNNAARLVMKMSKKDACHTIAIDLLSLGVPKELH